MVENNISMLFLTVENEYLLGGTNMKIDTYFISFENKPR